MRQLLNLALLRGEQTTGTQPEPSAPVSSDGNGVRLSRRRLIGVGGVAAIGLAPLVRAIGATVRSDFDVDAAPGRVAFLVDGEERWTVDAARFGGSPRVALERTA